MVAMSDDNDNFVWYSAGLHFECLQCGRCCSGPVEGYIWVKRPETQLIAKYLNISVRELKRNFLRRVGLSRTIIEDVHTRDCIFLRRGDKGKECSIYSVRPSQCRNWPFWPYNLAGPDSWNLAARKCPGINRGAHYGPGEIQAKANNKRWWRNDSTKY